MTRFPNCSHVSPGCTPGIRNRSFLPGFFGGCDPFPRGCDLSWFMSFSPSLRRALFANDVETSGYQYVRERHNRHVFYDQSAAMFNSTNLWRGSVAASRKCAYDTDLESVRTCGLKLSTKNASVQFDECEPCFENELIS